MPRTILVVEDNPITRKMMQVALESAGDLVLSAADGREALQLAATQPVDLILQDLILPDMDGFELARRFREAPQTRELPIVALSGLASKVEEARRFAAGFNEVLFKPIEPSRLRQVISQLCPTGDPSPASPGRGRSILLVEDDATQRKIHGLRLEEQGFRVRVARDGLEGLEEARREPPDAIVSDLIMPRMDGLDLCLSVRQDPRLAQLPFVLYSSAYIPLEEADQRLARSAGVSALVARTPAFDQVIERLLASLAGTPPPKPTAHLGALTAEYTSRLVRQLEQQATLNQSLMQQAASRTAQLSVMTAVAGVLARSRDLDVVLQEALARTLDVAGVSMGAIYLVDAAGNNHLVCQLGYSAANPKELEDFFGHPELLREALARGEPTALPTTVLSRAPSRALGATEEQSFSTLLPLIAGGERVGVLFMASAHRHLSPDWIEMASAVAVQIAHAVALARLMSGLSQSEEHYRTLFEGVPVGLYRLGPKGEILDGNAALVQLLGYPDLASLLSVNLDSFYVDAQDRQRWRRRLEREGVGRHFEVRFRTRDGSEIWVRNNGRAIRGWDGKIQAYEGSLEDITEQRRAEEALRESEERMRLTVHHALDAVITMDAAGRITGWNPQAERTFGWSEDEVLGRSLAETIVPPEYRTAHLRGLKRFLETGEGPVLNRRVELTGRHQSGVDFPLELAVTPMRVNGELGFSGFVRDITERRQAEEALRQSLALMRSVLEGTTDLVFVKDLEGRYLMVNSADAALIGKPVEEIIGHTDAELFPPAIAPLIRKADQEVIAAGQTKIIEETLAVAGKPRMFLSSKGVYRDQKGKVAGIFGISRDVTEAKQLELQLRQAQKMEAVGRLAGGIAHDFNNLLTAILSYADLLAEDLAPKDPRRVDAEEISRAAHRAAGLTRQLLAFSRSQVQLLKVLDLNEIVEGMDKMLRRIIGEDIELETRLAAELGHVKADPGQMEQVIMNLAVNARDAMPGGGRLTIETKDAVFDDQYRAIHEVVAPGNYVMLAVSDTGCGMDREEQSRIFEPFYTTKEPGKGTGLGLSTVYGIVKQSGGFIWVYSEPHQGATFKVYLPRVNEAVDVVPPSPPPPEPARGGETILLVEDEAPLRKVVHQILVRQGYTVLAANGGEEALALAHAHVGAIDLIATDVVMPGLGGRELVERLLAVHPEAGVLFMSGYTDDAVVHHGILERGTAFLQKPFSAAVLARKVREVLDSSETRIS